MSNFKVITVDQLIAMLKRYSYRYSQVHHTWRPNHSDFNGSNHIKLQQGMWNYHVKTNGWKDIGQHVTLFPDGLFVTGRPFNMTPAGISGYNTGAFMVEMVGDFDKGKDKLTGAQLYSMLKLQSYFLGRGTKIMFHREHAAKSCPGTGIDKNWFLSQVKGFKPSSKPVANYQPDPVHVEAAKQEIKGNKITVLGFGDRGNAVKQLQTDLKSLGYNVGQYGADGIFGRDTKDAVMKFQKFHGLVVDGLVGPKTLNKIASLKKDKTTPKPNTPKKPQTAYKYPLPSGILRSGSRGNGVKQLQNALNAVNFKCGKADGIFGTKTKDAIRRFQMVYLPYEVDGVYGPNTSKKLQAVLKSKGY